MEKRNIYAGCMPEYKCQQESLHMQIFTKEIKGYQADTGV